MQSRRRRSGPTAGSCGHRNPSVPPSGSSCRAAHGAATRLRPSGFHPSRKGFMRRPGARGAISSPRSVRSPSSHPMRPISIVRNWNAPSKGRDVGTRFYRAACLVLHPATIPSCFRTRGHNRNRNYDCAPATLPRSPGIHCPAELHLHHRPGAGDRTPSRNCCIEGMARRHRSAKRRGLSRPMAVLNRIFAGPSGLLKPSCSAAQRLTRVFILQC
jgi:hypothetical protein